MCKSTLTWRLITQTGRSASDYVRCTELKTLGMLTASVRNPRSDKRKRMDFYVAATHDRAILGMKGCQDLNLLYINEDNLCTIDSRPNGKIKSSAMQWKHLQLSGD